MKLFNVQHQLVFYGAYHHNKTNVWIHIVCVPLLVMTAQVMLARLPLPEALLDFRNSLAISAPGALGDYIRGAGWESILTIVYLAYYFTLEPLAALLYTPQMAFSTFLANDMAHTNKAGGITTAVIVHIVCWIAQFIGHGVYEKRAPALLDNLLGAVVLAPFFVHLEILFGMGYNKKLNDEVNRGVLKEIGRIRAEEQKKAK